MNFKIYTNNKEIVMLYTKNKNIEDSGIDVFFPSDITIKASYIPTIVDLNIVVKLCDVTGCYAPFYVIPRSNISKLPIGMANSVGLIDKGYNGNLKVAIRNYSNEDYDIKKHISLFQIVSPTLKPCSLYVELCDKNNLEKTIRGSGGFGSTGNC